MAILNNAGNHYLADAQSVLGSVLRIRCVLTLVQAMNTSAAGCAFSVMIMISIILIHCQSISSSFCPENYDYL